MEIKPPLPLAVRVGVQTLGIDDVAPDASQEERLVKTPGCTVALRTRDVVKALVTGSAAKAELPSSVAGGQWSRIAAWNPAGYEPDCACPVDWVH